MTQAGDKPLNRRKMSPECPRDSRDTRRKRPDRPGHYEGVALMQKRADLKATAYHEAGHAVIAWLCDHTLGEITIRPNHERGFDGNVQHNDAGCNDLFGFRELALDPDAPGGWAVRTGEATTRHLTEHERHWLHLHERLGLDGREFGPAGFWEPEVMIAAAGQEAQRRFDPDSVEPHQSEHDWDSIHESLERLAEKRGESMEAIRANLTARTAELLSDPMVWRVVRAIAKGLLESETLNDQEVTAIIRQTVSKDREPVSRVREGIAR